MLVLAHSSMALKTRDSPCSKATTVVDRTHGVSRREAEVQLRAQTLAVHKGCLEFFDTAGPNEAL